MPSYGKALSRPTKRSKAFEPLQVFWGRYLIDAVFRGGSAHSNHVRRVVTRLVSLIRRHYREDVPIIVVADLGFFDQQLFTLFDELGLGFVIGGKMYKDLKAYIGDLPEEQFFSLKKDRRSWLYCEFGNKRKKLESVLPHLLYQTAHRRIRTVHLRVPAARDDPLHEPRYGEPHQRAATPA